MALKVIHEDQVGRGPSAKLWQHFPESSIQTLGMTGIGHVFFDDFIGGPYIAATGSDGPYEAFVDTGGTIDQAVDEAGGVAVLDTSATDNDAVGLSMNGATYKIASTSGLDLWYEARVKVSSIADVAGFVGLAEEALAANDTLTDDDGALASKDFVGFHWDTAAPSTVDAVHRKAGAAAVVVSAGVHTLVADTFVKLGLKYDASKGTVTFYVNDAAVSTIVSDITVSTFPDGEELTPLFYIKTGEAVTKTLEIDWVKVAQRST